MITECGTQYIILAKHAEETTDVIGRWMAQACLCLALIGLVIGTGGCNSMRPGAEFEAFDYARERPDVSDSEQMQSDFYTCVDFVAAENQFIDCTDIFGPADRTLVVVAKLPVNEQRTRLLIELDAPNRRPQREEARSFRSGSIVGVRYNVSELIQTGGYGKWRANFYGDTLPIGYTDFYILAKPEEGVPADEAEDPQEGKYILK